MPKVFKMELRKILEILSFSVLLGVSLIFGFMGKNAEMGLSIAAGAISLVFLNLEKIASFKGGGIEIITKEQQEQIQAVIEKETEPSGVRAEGFGTDLNTRSVISALKNQKFTWRYVRGLVDESKQSKEQVEESLSWLLANGLAKKSRGMKGEIWSLSQKGREVFSQV